MSGLVISFMNYSPTRGIRGSQLVGFKYFIEFFSSPFFPRLLRNTVLLSLYGLLWGFPIPIIFALLLNEVKNGLFKRTVQTVSYMPYFISVVVLAGMVQSFLTPYDGAVNKIIAALGYETVNFMVQPRWFRTIYIASGIWQGFGYESIVYLAAISAVDTQMYEAARIDGATRMQIILRITLPGIAPTAIILLIMNFGRIMNIGFEKVNLLYSPAVYETADVIATYVYRRGILDGQFSFATAVGLFNSAVNLILILTVNWISKRVTEVSLW
jgi:putative aldouronate transport system permease protein